jgi:rRNA methylases
MDAVLLTPACSNPLYRRAIRVSMGTVFQVPWAYFPKYNVGSDNTFSDASLHDKCDSRDQNCSDRNSSVYKYNIDVLHKLGFKTCAMALTDDSVSIDDPVLHSEERLAIVLGTEGDGLHEQTIDSCDYTVKIPMSHGVDSLNVAAASAVAFWELAK